MELILSLISGAVGGDVAGGALKKFDLGILGNSVAGIAGGGIGGQILGLLGAGGIPAGDAAAGGLDIGSIIGSIASGGVGGGALLAIIGIVKNAMGK